MREVLEKFVPSKGTIVKKASVTSVDRIPPKLHIRQVALETITARGECMGYQYLQYLNHQWSFESRREVIHAFGSVRLGTGL